MNRSLDILKAIYKPYRYTIKGKATILETTSGDFLIKEKNKDLNELYNYLISRGFDNFPKLIDSSRKDINVFEYVESITMPKEQMCDDIIDLIASLHNKTSYFKEVSEDKFKSIYEDIKSNISFLKNYYDTMYEIGFSEEFMSPATYLFMRNFYKINAALDFCDREIDEWYELIKGESKIRVSVVHNNLSIEHFLKGNKEVLISWDNYLIDTPIIDIVKLYKNEYLNMNFSEVLERYFYKFSLLPYEQKLLFVLITMPPEIKMSNDEFNKCKNISKVIDYVFKTEDLIRPYYAEEEEKK
ncbi:MAG TPA: hypothetical protein IAB65_01390 [Candidatus Onthocola stercorigallinarum]|nr:hypothetical protein [Candidatus Onthocola stercorigallinarum]